MGVEDAPDCGEEGGEKGFSLQLLLTMSFLSHALGLSPIFIDLSFQAQLGVHFHPHGTASTLGALYLFSTTLYGGRQPFAICLLTSVLAYNIIT